MELARWLPIMVSQTDKRYNINLHLDLNYLSRSIQTVIGFVMFLLALYKAIKDWRLMRYKKTDLVHILIRDQIYYYIV